MGVELILNLTKSKTMEAAAEELARVSGGSGSGSSGSGSSGSSDGAAGGGLASLEVLPGRPDYAALFARLEEENAGVGVGAVSVCGPGPMVDSVQQTLYDRNSSAFEWRFARETFLM